MTMNQAGSAIFVIWVRKEGNLFVIFGMNYKADCIDINTQQQAK